MRRDPECPYCGSRKKKIFEKGEIGNIISDGYTERGSICEYGHTCGNCDKSFNVVVEIYKEELLKLGEHIKKHSHLSIEECKKIPLPDIKQDTYIKYNKKYDKDFKVIAFDRKPIDNKIYGY